MYSSRLRKRLVEVSSDKQYLQRILKLSLSQIHSSGTYHNSFRSYFGCMNAIRSLHKVLKFLLSLRNDLPVAYPVGYEPERKPGEYRIVFGGRVIIQQTKPCRHDAVVGGSQILLAGCPSTASPHSDLCRSNFLDSVSVAPVLDE